MVDGWRQEGLRPSHHPRCLPSFDRPPLAAASPGNGLPGHNLDRDPDGDANDLAPRDSDVLVVSGVQRGLMDRRMGRVSSVTAGSDHGTLVV